MIQWFSFNINEFVWVDQIRAVRDIDVSSKGRRWQNEKGGIPKVF
jgi:hypothetical protein